MLLGHLGRKMIARACLGETRAFKLTARACFGDPRALKMSARPCSAATWALRITARACFGAAGALKMTARACFAGTACSKPLRSSKLPSHSVLETTVRTLHRRLCAFEVTVRIHWSRSHRPLLNYTLLSFAKNMECSGSH